MLSIKAEILVCYCFISCNFLSTITYLFPVYLTAPAEFQVGNTFALNEHFTPVFKTEPMAKGKNPVGARSKRLRL